MERQLGDKEEELVAAAAVGGDALSRVIALETQLIRDKCKLTFVERQLTDKEDELIAAAAEGGDALSRVNVLQTKIKSGQQRKDEATRKMLRCQK